MRIFVASRRPNFSNYRMVHDECDTVTIGFAGQCSVKSFISPFSNTQIQAASCQRIQTTRLSRARRQRHAHIAVMQSAKYEGGKDGLSAVPPASEKNQTPSVNSQRPTLHPPPRRNLKQLDDVNGTSLSLKSLENGKGSENTTIGVNSDSDANAVHDELREGRSDFNEESDNGIHDDMEVIGGVEDRNRSAESFSAPFRKPMRNSKSSFGTKQLDIFSRREFGAEQQIVDNVEKRLRQDLSVVEGPNSNFEDVSLSNFGTTSSTLDEYDNNSINPNGRIELNDHSLSEALRQKGHVAESKGHHSLAGSFYSRSIQYNINNGKAWQNLAKSEGRRKQSMRASAHILRRALEHNPKNAFLWQSLGFLLFRMRQYESARMHFEKGIVVDPNHAPLYSTWAHMEYGMKEIDRARELYEKGSKIEKGGARVFQNWGQMEEKLGNSTRAMELYEKGLEMEPSNPFLLETLGIIAAKNKDFDQAREYFRTALNSDEHRASICESFAEMEGRLGNHEEARKLFEEGVSADVKNSRVLRTWSTYELKLGNFDAAKELVDRAVLISPFDSVLWTLYARTEAASGNHARARAMFNRAVEINQKDWRAWDAWSAMEHELGNLEQSEKLLRESFRIRFKAEGDFSILANAVKDRFSHN